MNYLRVLHVVGLLVVIVSSTMIAPLIVSAIEGEFDAVGAFCLSLLAGLSAGGVMWVAGRRGDDHFYRREALASVALAWIVCALFGCLPYLLTGAIPGFVDAYFETMSGFTTTGASVMRQVEVTDAGVPVAHGILFWRCMTNWVGGVGIVVLFVAVLPAFAGGSRLIFHIEVPGVGEKGFMPKIRQTAMALWLIYLSLTGAQIALMMAFGVGWFDAVCHAFASVSSGGFSPHTASVGFFDSTAVRIVVTVFMFLAGVNFTLYYRMITRGWKRFLKDPELEGYATLVFLAIAVITVDLLVNDVYAGTGEALREGAFQVASISTTTGFATADFDLWPATSKLVLVFLMFVGGSAGSTAGGIKVFRLMIVWRYALRQLKMHIRPRAVEQVKIGEATIPIETIRSVMSMVLLFVLLFFGGALALAAMGLDLTSAVTASIACLGNIGPGLGAVGPAGNYADLPAGAKMLCAFLMLVGRLEIFTALALFAPGLWRD